MTTPQATADLVRTAVRSTSTCTPSTVTELSDLLIPKAETQKAIKPTISKRATKTAASLKSKGTKSGTAKPKIAIALSEDESGSGLQLSPKERSILATEIINTTLKVLSDAIRAPAPGPVRRQASSKDLVRASARKALRRSNSLPQSPLQARSLNRVSSSPSVSNGESRSSSTSSITFSGHRSIAECARIAFSCLRTLQGSTKEGIDVPTLQLEIGMSVLIGKLLSLRLDDLAIKELRILKRRLDLNGPKSDTTSKGTNTAQTLAELLDFGKTPLTGAKLGLAITTQLQVLRFMTSSRKPRHAEAALSTLITTHPSSPTRLLLLAAKESKDTKQAEKISRQLQTLSEILLSLTPSVSPSDDALALESRISVNPEVAVQLQTLALHNRFLWWGVAGHKGELARDIFDPFLRCLTSFARRTQRAPAEKYRICNSVSMDIMTLLEDCSDSHLPLNSTIGGVYTLLGTLAKDANLIPEAISWTEKYQRRLDPKNESEARRCSLIARLVSLKLRVSALDPEDEGLLLNLLDELERPFKGESSEIDDLLLEVHQARRSATAVLSHYEAAPGKHPAEHFTDGFRQMCESLIFLCPRLSIRYLGTPPDLNSATKDIVRYEQRRFFIFKQALGSVDSVLFLSRNLLGEGRISWDLVDSKLQDCLLLLNRLELGSEERLIQGGSPSTSYYVRISNLYYTQYLDMRRTPDKKKDGQLLRVLRRSIDCILARPIHERKAAQLSTKLERMAEFCKTTSRYDELSKALSSLRDELISHGCLAAVAEMVSFQPIWSAWNEDTQASILGRTIQAHLKVQLKYPMTTAQIPLFDSSWSEEEIGAVLEHQLDTLSKHAGDSTTAFSLLSEAFRKLLFLYDRTRFPIRRLRVLLRLWSQEVEKPEEIKTQVEAELRPSSIAALVVGGSKDERLAGYLNHIRAMATTTIELQQQNPRIDVIIDCLKVWSSIRSRCEDIVALEREVDDVPGLTTHLQMIGDFLGMRGFDSHRLAVLRLIITIDELYKDKSNPDDLVFGYTSLGIQWLQLGYSGKAGLALDRARTYSHQNGVTAFASLQLEVSYSQYLLAIGSIDKIDDNLTCAQTMYSLAREQMSKSKSLSVLQQKIKMNLLVSDAFLMYSMLALERGATSVALTLAKKCVRLLRRAWANTEEMMDRTTGSPGSSSKKSTTDRLTEDLSQLSISTITAINTTTRVDETTAKTSPGSSFWKLVAPIFRGLQHLSQLYAHNGMFQETLYYAQQAYKLSKEVGSGCHLATAGTLVGSTWLKSGTLDKGLEFLMEAHQISSQCEVNHETVVQLHHLGKMHGHLGDRAAELVAYDNAQEILQSLTKVEYIENLDKFANLSSELTGEMANLTISKRKAPGTRKATGRPKAAPAKSKAVPGANSPVKVTSSVAEECGQLTSLKAVILRQKAEALMSNKKWVEALALLSEAETFASTQIDIIDQGLATAKQLLLQSLEQMNADPVYSVLQDSTISFPSVVGLTKTEKQGERLSVVKLSPSWKAQMPRNNRDRGRSKSPAPARFFDKLRQAQERLVEVHSTAASSAPLAIIHKVSALLNSVAILLSAAGQIKGKSLANPGFASCSIETARNLARRRELRAMRGDSITTLTVDESIWPSLGCCDSRRSSFGDSNDMSRFQKDYIDIIPHSWTVVSIALGDNRKELSITKFQAGYGPFILRLPLGRHNSMDADEEVFGFEQGHSELMEVISAANESAHDAHGRTGREAKIAWWEEREALDARLRDLLENIQKVWLGGFTGIFSQHARRPALLARFQKSFQNILDKHLPSRQKTGKRQTGLRITLDSRIVDLFIGLGDASDEDRDFSEPLTDLLYFVVDVLQFHGELNAYAEIDFDSIVVETHDALRSYYEAVRASNRIDEAGHTILILDKALHCLPWESLPCMNGLAVSRVTSLACLRDRIIGQGKGSPNDAPQGCYIDRGNGSYILNPSGDLKSTQGTFQKPLESLNGWTGIVNRVPTEEEIKSTLQSKDLLLYFGHGSGAQYIRAREIKKLEKCAVTVLMGCSSGALIETGDFEPYGPPVNYMHAGCPALVATLWDVTDKDIDRFAKTTFEHWGLYDPEPTKGKGKTKAEANKQISLVEAVAKGRNACNLRYLNAASVCVYGVPVYFR